MTTKDQVKKIRKAIDTELGKPGVLVQLQSLHQEEAHRTAKWHTPTVVRWQEPDAPTRKGKRPNHYFGLRPPAGSITLYWARKEAEIIDSLAGAHLAGDAIRLAEFHDQLAPPIEKRSVQPVAETVKEVRATSSFFDLRYDKKTLAKHVFLPAGLKAGSMIFPYAGGEIADHQFQIVEYIRPGRSSDLEMLVVVNPPELTELERRVVELIPEEQRELLIGQPDKMAVTVTTIVVLAVVAINTGVTTCCGPFHDRLAEVGLPPDYPSTRGAKASVRELLRARQEIFASFAVR